ncbi:histidine kinase [Halobiforma lacisalsi AJ5]|uniref:Histidine kinase n=1 Tax=Natronobacterium lacisalsi AJ5 TaxID=358396 RepID=M0LS70_NATLA|nr:HAMP domain-containing sensor histidine kinase [Halobiforma lacisalsi]APW96245.1 histidine kinase [Halobiforma lacisalsi AJ5]EMA36412.1 signal-transducing histidine kinase [Halobiforma lacisalsi AJ5]
MSGDADRPSGTPTTGDDREEEGEGEGEEEGEDGAADGYRQVPPTGLEDESEDTIQLLVTNDGDRSALRELLADQYRVVTDRLEDADLYLVEDRTFPEYREALRERTETADPTFVPVVVVRGPDSSGRSWPALEQRSDPPVVDDVVDAPIDPPLLYRRLESLLVRRRQSIALADQVATLEERERELRGFKRVVEQTGHSITITDTDGEIQYVNPSFEEITGYTASEAIGRNPRILQSGEHDDEFYTELWGTIRSGDVWKGEVVNERKDGTRYVVDQTIAPITANGDIEGYISVNSDITDRIQRERELRQRERELEVLRQILTRVLRHNIRNALTVVSGYAERIATDLEEPYAGMGEAILETTDKIERTSENARAISAILEESGGVTEHDLATVVENAVATVRERYPAVTIDVDVPSEYRVLAGAHLQHAVDNLVENAAQHNDADEPRIDIVAETAEDVRLVVEDNGPGIPEHELEPLDSAEETPLEHASSTGLWLINWVVELSDGSLEFDVSEDGTRVEIELPAAGAVDPA